ncbi:YIP1 family protein [Limisphaera ngatamarikiensis]|uniref:YIP1 family protein n=1 Tax=Limisphaera ngatamarikiensis TaxID=1324935 RepID=A0A6M1RGJ0_9BACT|nr:Yip1 family protein [Limisphaera ngatamarikiensis]NGO38716.1 YIP1 family protein [Limisphaera ngatamarikiensis]
MIRALLLVLEPERSWDEIATKQRSIARVFWLYVMPLLLLTSVIEGLGMHYWGEWRGEPPRLKLMTVPEVVVMEVAQILVHVAVLFFGAKMFKSLGETFHGQHTYHQAFTVVAYGLGPYWTVRILDAWPAVSPWFTYAIGIALTVAVLYHGVPRIMMPDPPQAFGVYLIGSLVLALATGIGKFLLVWLQQGRFIEFERVLVRWVSLLLGG